MIDDDCKKEKKKTKMVFWFLIISVRVSIGFCFVLQ